MEKIKSLLHSGQDHSEGAQSGTAQGNTTNTTAPHHSSGLTGEGTHFSDVKDSTTTDQHHGNEYGSVNPSGYGVAQGLGTQSGSATAGPHSSNIANKADPRVDSDNSRTLGSGLAGSTGAYGSGTHDAGIQSSSTTAGPHSSNLANKADPRVDSDNSRLAGSTGGYASTSGGSFHTGPSGSAVGSGPHSTETANRLDPSLNRGATGIEDARQHDNIHGGGGEQADVQHGAREGSLTGAGTGLQQHVGHSTSSENAHGLGQSSTGNDTNMPSGSHNYGRDAAIGAGAAGATGLAGHEYGKHQSQTSHGVGNNPTKEPDMSHMPGSFPSGADPAPTTAGTQKYNNGNELDPSVTANPQSSTRGAEYGSATQPGTDSAVRTGHQTSGLGGSGAPATSGIPEHTRATQNPHSSVIENRADPTRDQYNDSTSKDHHYGRDAALAGGAAGVAGAAYGAGRHHGSNNTTTSTAGLHDSNLANRGDPRVDSDVLRDQGVSGSGYSTQRQTPAHGVTTTTTTHTSSSTTGPHSSDIVNKADPRVDSDRSKDHHYGRDAALTGGAAAGGYGASQLHDNKTTAGPHSSDTANKADPTVDSDRSKDHHYGRDAAVAGGAGGAAAYGAHKYNERDDKDLKKAEKEAEKDRKHAEKEAEKDRKHAEKEHEKDRKHAEKEHEKQEKKSGGFLSFLHRDKNKKYSKEEEDEFDRQEREHNSHKGRDAALAAGAGGAVAGGAYTAHQHDSSHGTTDSTTNKPLPTAPGNHGIGTGPGTQNALSSDSTTSHGDHMSSGHHSGPTPLAEQPLGTAIGDKLHGVERNRGVAGSTGFPHEQQGEHDANEFRKQQVATAAATQPTAHSSATTEHHGDTTSHGSGVAGSGLTGSGNQHEHHTGRDAAAVGGAAGLGAVGAHEYQKHHDSQGSSQPSGLTGSQYDNTNTRSSDLGGTHGAAGVGPGQTSGLGGSDYNNPSRTTGGLTSGSRDIGEHNTTHDGSHLGGGSSGLASGQQPAVGSSGYGDSAQSDGRNRLHKDPPAGHASSKLTDGSGGDGHVPASGQERKGIMDRGRGELGDDTGVGNSHADGSTRNY